MTTSKKETLPGRAGKQYKKHQKGKRRCFEREEKQRKPAENQRWGGKSREKG